MTKQWNGLLVYDKEGSKRNASYIKMHEEAGEKLNMPIHFLYDTDVMELKEYPDYVIKAVDGHGGKQVFLTNESFDLIQTGIAGSDFILQPFVKGPGVDLRVYIIGKKIVGAIKRQANNSFRANFSLGGSVTSYQCDKEILDYVNQVVQVFDFGMVGIDFILDEKNHWLLNEIEDVV
uniref:ATP-grasp domain-containing protein n=1 Tax=Eubacterium sp. TaxID=142586 RepID=UPI003FED5DD8